MVGVGAGDQLRHEHAGAIGQGDLHIGRGEWGSAQVLHRQAVGGRKPQDVSPAPGQRFRLDVLRVDGLAAGIGIQHNAHALAAVVFDQVIAIAQGKMVGVHARAAAEYVGAGAAPKGVVPIAAAQVIVTRAAVQLVGARAAQQGVRTQPAPQCVGPVAAVYRVAAGPAQNQIVTAACQHIVVARARVNYVGIGAAGDGVGPSAGKQPGHRVDG